MSTFGNSQFRKVRLPVARNEMRTAPASAHHGGATPGPSVTRQKIAATRKPNASWDKQEPQWLARGAHLGRRARKLFSSWLAVDCTHRGSVPSTRIPTRRLSKSTDALIQMSSRRYLRLI